MTEQWRELPPETFLSIEPEPLDEEEFNKLFSTFIEKHLETCTKCSMDELTLCPEAWEEIDTWEAMDTLRK